MDTKNVTITMEPRFARLMEAYSFTAGLKVGARNNAADQKRVQTVHDMASEMGVTRDCNKSGEAKAGARFSKDDMAMVEKIHDHAVNLGAECGPQGEGNYPESKIAKREDVKPEGGKEKYGNVSFADEKNKKYPIDTEAHIRAAWNYINKPKNAGKYSSEDVGKIKKKIVAAWKEKIDKEGPPSAAAKSDGAKNNSLQDLVNDIRAAWYEWWEEEDAVVTDYPKDCDEPGEYGFCPSPIVIDVLDDSIVIKCGTKEYRVGYTMLGVDDYDFDAPDKWTQVEYTWEDVSQATASEGQVKSGLVSTYGTALKVGDDGHLRGYLIRFTTPKDPDTDKDFFTKETDFCFKSGMKTPVFFHHTLPLKNKAGKTVQIKEKIGEAELDEDENGILIDAIIYNNMKYREALMKATKSLGWSSGTAQHLVMREKKDNAFWIKRWPLGLDASITPTPAEIRNEVVAMKTFQINGIQTPEVDFDEPEDTSKAAVSGDGSGNRATEGSTKTNSQGDIQMTPEEIQAAIKAALKAQKDEDAAAAAVVKAAEDAKVAREKEIADAVDAALKSRGVRVVRKPVNAGGVKTDEKNKATAFNDKTGLGDDAFKAFNWYLKTGDREALRDTERMNSEDAELLNPENFRDQIKTAAQASGLKTTYSVLEITQYQGQELVPTEVYNRIIELRDPMSIARVGGATVIPIGARTMNVPVEKNRSGKFIIANEGSSYDANAAQPFDKRAITAFKFTRTIAMGIEVMEDSVADLTNWWTRHVARMEALTENYYFTIGASGGASAPEGITTGGTAAITLASSTTISAAEVVQLFYKLPQPYRDSPSYVCNGNTEGIIRALSGNWFQFQPTPSGSGGGNYPMGSDWIISPKCKLLVASDMADFSSLAIVACVGNWAEYVVAERSAMSIFRDPYSSAASGLVNFHCHFRRGGMVGIAEAFQYATAHST